VINALGDERNKEEEKGKGQEGSAVGNWQMNRGLAPVRCVWHGPWHPSLQPGWPLRYVVMNENMTDGGHSSFTLVQYLHSPVVQYLPSPVASPGEQLKAKPSMGWGELASELFDSWALRPRHHQYIASSRSPYPHGQPGRDRRVGVEPLECQTVRAAAHSP